MSYISHYWDNKEDRAVKAAEHTKNMNSVYGNAIESSVKNTKLYDINFKCESKVSDKDTKILVENLDTVSAACKYKDCGKLAVLNFSSYKNPGGGFMNGSRAQEECLCHASFLYNVLCRFTREFYDWNNGHKNNALYMNRGLYTPDVMFNNKGTRFSCGVITCAAPNKTTAQKYRNVTEVQNSKALKSRIKFVLDIAKDNEVNTLILGAYGCGVFGQNPVEVAEMFKQYLITTHQCFDTVIFAIPQSRRDRNYESFVRAFSEE